MKSYLSYNGENYTNHPDTAHVHSSTTLGNIKNKVLAVGGGRTNKVELFDINADTWTEKTSYPWCNAQ